MRRNWLQEWLTVGAPPGFGSGPAVRAWGNGATLVSDGSSGPLPGDLRGTTVLHVGCDAGALCLEALRRGATRVVGVDHDADRIGLARSYASLAGLPAEFQVLRPDEAMPRGRFQVVVCSDLGRYPDPSAMIDRLGRMVDERLILEWEGPAGLNAAAYLDRIGAPRLTEGMTQLPAVLVGDDRTGQARSYPTAAAVERLLKARSGRFSKVEVNPIGRSGRYRAVATRRVIRRLVVVAAAGRSEASWVVSMLRQRRVPEGLLDRIGLEDPSRWLFSYDGQVQGETRLVTPGLVFAYDLNGAWRKRAGRFGLDELADLIDSAVEVHIVTCWADPDTLKRRGRIRVGRSSVKLRHLERHPFKVLVSTLRGLTQRAVKAPPSRWTPRRLRRFIARARRELDVDRRTHRERARMEVRQADERAYRRTDEHLLRYARWLDYCRRVDADGHWILDNSHTEWNVEAADRWGHLLIERAKRRFAQGA